MTRPLKMLLKMMLIIVAIPFLASAMTIMQSGGGIAPIDIIGPAPKQDPQKLALALAQAEANVESAKAALDQAQAAQAQMQKMMPGGMLAPGMTNPINTVCGTLTTQLVQAKAALTAAQNAVGPLSPDVRKQAKVLAKAIQDQQLAMHQQTDAQTVVDQTNATLNDLNKRLGLSALGGVIGLAIGGAVLGKQISDTKAALAQAQTNLGQAMAQTAIKNVAVNEAQQTLGVMLQTQVKPPVALGPVAQGIADIPTGKIVKIKASNGNYLVVGGDQNAYWLSATAGASNASQFTVTQNPDGSINLMTASAWGNQNVGSINAARNDFVIIPAFGVVVNRDNVCNVAQQSWKVSFVPTSWTSQWFFLDQNGTPAKMAGQLMNLGTSGYLNNQGTAYSGGVDTGLRTSSTAGNAPMTDASKSHTQFQFEVVGQVTLPPPAAVPPTPVIQPQKPAVVPPPVVTPPTPVVTPPTPVVITPVVTPPTPEVIPAAPAVPTPVVVPVTKVPTTETRIVRDRMREEEKEAGLRKGREKKPISKKRRREEIEKAEEMTADDELLERETPGA